MRIDLKQTMTDWKEIEEELLKANKLSAVEIVGDSKREHGFNNQMGSLVNATSFKVETSEIEIFNNNEYAKFVHDGTGRFTKGGGGRSTPWRVKLSPYYANKYNTKGFTTIGQKPKEWLKNAIEKNLDKVERRYIEAFQRGFGE